MLRCVPAGAENHTAIGSRSCIYRAIPADDPGGRSITIAGTLPSPEKWLKKPDHLINNKPHNAIH
jgi:hypothetical protein